MEQSVATLLVLVLHVCTVLSTVTEHTEHHHHHNEGKREEVENVKNWPYYWKRMPDIGEICIRMTLMCDINIWFCSIFGGWTTKISNGSYIQRRNVINNFNDGKMFTIFSYDLFIKQERIESIMTVSDKRAHL